MKQLLERLGIIAVFIAVFMLFAGLAYMIRAAHDPEKILEQLLVRSDRPITQALFTPDDDVRSTLIDLIAVEKQRIICAIYTITEKNIVYALIDAHRRGVVVEIVVDGSYGTDRYSKVPLLADHQVPLWIYRPDNDSIMHHKFCVFFDNIHHASLLWTGSFNFTVRASNRNQENVIICQDHNLIQAYVQQFERLKSRSRQLNGAEASIDEDWKSQIWRWLVGGDYRSRTL